MRAAIRPRFVNSDPFDDPGLFIHFAYAKRALLFDMGDLHALSPKDILKITHIFVSHTHVDHFIGFDHLLRTCLGRDVVIHLFGPQGIMDNVQGKLAGYTWNLLDNYSNDFGLNVTEVNESGLRSCKFLTSNGFNSTPVEEHGPFTGVLLEEPDFTIQAEILDHGTPCLGFALKERFHINILKTKLEELDLEVGPWLREFKQALFAQEDWTGQFSVPMPDGEAQMFTLEELARKITTITPGQKIVYITDVAGHTSNRKKILSLAKEADQLFIEAAFAHEDSDYAMARNHLTASQAGELARIAGARQIAVFHYSPRYQDTPDLLEEQAKAAFKKADG